MHDNAHICKDKNWRKHQLFGYLDNGTLYSTYGTFHKKGLKKWGKEGDICGVTLDRSVNPMKATFYVGREEQCTVELPEDVDGTKIVLSVRVHPDGAVESIPPLVSC